MTSCSKLTFKERTTMQKRKIFTALVIAAGLSATALAAKELAKVNGKPITDKDMIAALGGMNEGGAKSALKDVNSRRSILAKLVDQEILVQEAEKQKLDQDEQYKDALNAFRKQFLTNRVLQQNLGSKLTDAATKKYYENNKTRYSTDEVHAQHILVKDEKDARDILAKAKAPGADFQKLAEQNSKDPSAKNNRGDLGYFGRDRMVPEFTEAAFAAKDGEIVGPVKTSFGFHIIKVIERKVGKPMTYDEVEMRVRNDYQQELIKNFLDKLRSQSKVTIDDNAVSKM